jgi:pimeloyl-ACP methyl ester carboxylesterase
MSNPALLLLPGLLCDRAVFEPILGALEPHAQCHIPAYPAERSVVAMAQRALDHAPERFALLGHSMGGRVALEVLRAAPARVERVALLDTGYTPLAQGDAGERERAGRYELLEIARTQGMRTMARRWVQRMVHPDRLHDAPLVDSILDMFARRNTVEFAAQIQALLSRPSAGDVLAAIDVPALILCGRQDAWATPSVHEDMAARVKGSYLAAIDHCGHMCTMEQPDAVAGEIVAWLNRPALDRG